MIISLIVAVSKNGVIGKDNKIPWRIPEDLKRFKSLTLGHHIIMGRKTFESIGKPLQGRHSIILSQNVKYDDEKCIVLSSLDKAFHYCRKKNEDEAFVIGGEGVFKEAFLSNSVDKIYLTRVHNDYEGDVSFSAFDESKYNIVEEEHHQNYSFINYIRK